MQRSTLLSIKTGGCSGRLRLLPQSARYDTGLERERLLPLDEVPPMRVPPRKGASCFAWRSLARLPRQRPRTGAGDGARSQNSARDLCDPRHASRWPGGAPQDAGLDYYNHNIDTAPEHYGKVITTHTLQDRLDTLDKVRNAGDGTYAAAASWAWERTEEPRRPWSRNWPT